MAAVVTAAIVSITGSVIAVITARRLGLSAVQRQATSESDRLVAALRARLELVETENGRLKAEVEKMEFENEALRRRVGRLEDTILEDKLGEKRMDS